MRYSVSRQSRWPAGDLVVEIAAGGIECSGPDMLCDDYKGLGEGLETNDPCEALAAAFAVRDEWNRELKAAYIAGECSLGDPISCHIEAGYDLDVVAACEGLTDEQLREWAEGEWEKAPKCAHCGEAIGDPPYSLDGEVFCSTRCVDAHAWRWEED